MSIRAPQFILLGTLVLTGDMLVAQWRPIERHAIQAPKRGDAPIVAVTSEELGNLRRAHNLGLRPVTKLVQTAEANLGKAIVYPPRGGQHNQWYQCDDCQLALETVDAEHHRCPKCKKVYSGPPYDDVIFSRVHLHNLGMMRDAAWAFAITQETRYLEFARPILLGYASRYERYPHHGNDRLSRTRRSGGHIKEQTLSEASLFIQSVVPAVDLLWKDLTPEQRTQILDHLVRPLLDNLNRHKAGKSNWQSFHNAAMLAGGALLSDVEWMQRALFQPKNGFLFQMEACVSREGMWFENSWSYHFYTLLALTSTAETARRLGIDLWHHPKFAAMYSLAPQYVMSDGTLPRFGDATTSRLASRGRQLEAAFAALGDDAIGQVLPRKPTWAGLMRGRFDPVAKAAPKLISVRFLDAGHAILRRPGSAGQASQSLSAAMTFGPFGGFHGHFDKLSFVFFAGGQELAVDPGRSRSQAYRLPIHRNWYRATVAHNAITVDGRSQKGAGGRLLAFVDKPAWSAAVAECTKGYKGVRHARLLLLTKDCLIVVDDLRSEREHEYTWMYHDTARIAEAPGLMDKPQALAGQGWEFIKVTEQGSVKGGTQVRFPRQNIATVVTIDAGAALLTLGDGPFESVLNRAALMAVTRSARDLRIAAVIEPESSGKSSGVISVRVDGDDIHIVRQTGEQLLIWDGAKRIRFSGQ